MRKKNVFLFSIVTLLIFANINNNPSLRISKKLFFFITDFINFGIWDVMFC